MRLIKRKLLFRGTENKCGINFFTECSCCRIPQAETMQHVFVSSEEASRLWSSIDNPLGIQHHDEHIISTLSRWWTTKHYNNIHQMILKVVPIFICYEIWKQKCACKYGTQRTFHYKKMEHQSIWAIKFVISRLYTQLDYTLNWDALCILIEKRQPVMRVEQVQWKMPLDDSIKVNIRILYVLMIEKTVEHIY